MPNRLFYKRILNLCKCKHKKTKIRWADVFKKVEENEKELVAPNLDKHMDPRELPLLMSNQQAPV